MNVQLDKNGDTLWIGSNNLYFSVDHGMNWNLSGATIETRNDITISSDDKNIFVSSEKNNQAELYYSLDNGLSWIKSDLHASSLINSILVSG